MSFSPKDLKVGQGLPDLLRHLWKLGLGNCKCKLRWSQTQTVHGIRPISDHCLPSCVMSLDFSMSPTEHCDRSLSKLSLASRRRLSALRSDVRMMIINLGTITRTDSSSQTTITHGDSTGQEEKEKQRQRLVPQRSPDHTPAINYSIHQSFEMSRHHIEKDSTSIREMQWQD